MSEANTTGRLKVFSTYADSELRDEDDNMIAVLHSCQGASEDARRLAACWNACHGISTEVLDDAVAPGLIKRMVANEVRRITAERDALAGKLAELDRQEPVAVVCDTYELRWIGCGPIAPIISRHQIKVGDSLYARPVPAEPVNARLLAALLYWRDECSGAEPSISAFSRMVDEAIAAAESAPKAVRLTDEEIIGIRQVLAGWDCNTPWSQTIALSRAIETAVLRKNGIKVAE